MAIPIFQVDAFADRPFTGNPAAVCLLDRPRPAAWMQAVAQEMGLSETAFLLAGDEAHGLRWFTPAVEVRLCGHATLATAHVLWSEGLVAGGRPIRFDTASGRLAAVRGDGLIELDFPSRPPQPVDAPEGLEAAVGVPILEAGRSAEDFLVRVDSEQTLRALVPDITALRGLPVRGTIVTAPASSAGVDFVSRFFAPAVGVDEDPVTGSAHCCLAPYWSERLGRSELVGRQCSARGGRVSVRVDGDRVHLGGHAVTVLRGELLVDA